MGFADLSIAEIAADYSLVEEVLLCDQLGIACKTCMALAKGNYFPNFVSKTRSDTGVLKRSQIRAELLCAFLL